MSERTEGKPRCGGSPGKSGSIEELCGHCDDPSCGFSSLYECLGCDDCEPTPEHQMAEGEALKDRMEDR